MDLFYENSNDNFYPDLDEDIKNIIDNDWDPANYEETPIEELYRMPSHKFIKLVNFEIINEQYEDGKSPQEFQQQTEEELILQLLNHPYGDGSMLDDAYRCLSLAIEEYEKQLLSDCEARARGCFQHKVNFQLQKRSESCPVCFDDTCFQDCQNFYQCQTCQGGICADCGPLVGNKCPLCNIKVPLKRICLDTETAKQRSTLPPKLSVRSLIYDIMYRCEKGSNKNLFGLPCDTRFNIENLTDVDLDFEIAEFLRHTHTFLTHKQKTMAQPTYQKELQERYWWAAGLVPLLHL